MDYSPKLTVADGAAHVFPISMKGVVIQNNRVLLAYNERNEWELPGGKLELGETPQECLAREIEEEVRWKVQVGPLLDVWMYHIRESCDVFIVTYGCIMPTPESPVVSHEHSKVNLFSEEEIAQLTMPQGYKDSIYSWYAHLKQN